MSAPRNAPARSFFRLVLAAALGLACGAPVAAQSAKTLVIAQGAGPTTLDPLREQSGPMMNIWTLVFDGLTRRGDDGNIEPALAISWRTISDTEWEFKLREGVQFHNGEPFDASAPFARSHRSTR
jgi:peptide/nickel transport system substrate-binding protein